MSRKPWIAATLLVLALGAAPSLAGGNVNFVLGSRAMSDEDTWGETPLFDVDLERQPVFGVNVDFGGMDWPVNLELGVHSSAEESEDSFYAEIPGIFLGTETDEFDATLTEFSVGVLKRWEVGFKVRPYIGGGLTFMNTEVEVTVRLDGNLVGSDSDTYEDQSQGLYAHGGVLWRLGSRFNIGFDGRFVFGTEFEDQGVIFGLPLELEDGDADYAQFALILGWGWPPE